VGFERRVQVTLSSSVNRFKWRLVGKLYPGIWWSASGNDFYMHIHTAKAFGGITANSLWR
jgi:hypothetical protein